MLKTVAAGFAAFAVACTLATSRAQPASAPRGEPVVSAAKHRNDLLAQCPPATPRLPEAEAAKLPIHATNWGTVGPTVLIVHGGVQGGLGGNPATFAKQEPLAEQGWRLQVVDRPGFGQSQSRGMDDMEADAVWIADMLGDGANLIGHSWGGAEALLAAARRSEAVRSLVLIEPAVQGLLADDPAVEKDPALKADAKRWAEVLTSARTPAEYALALNKSLSGAETGGVDTQRAERYGCALLQGRMASPPALLQAAEAIARARVPVLVITGGWSPFFDAGGKKIAELTGGRHEVVRSSNHFVQLTGAEEFNKVVDTFMRDADKVRPGH